LRESSNTCALTCGEELLSASSRTWRWGWSRLPGSADAGDADAALVRWALDGRPAARLELRVRLREGALGISVESDAAEGQPPPEATGRRAQALDASLPGTGTLDVSTDAGKRRAVMEIPL